MPAWPTLTRRRSAASRNASSVCCLATDADATREPPPSCRPSPPKPARAPAGAPRPAPLRRARTARSLEDLRGAVAARQSDLVGARRPVRAVVEVHEEPAVELHPAAGVEIGRAS